MSAVELIFNPNWWFNTAGISFDRSFYLDPAARIRNDVTMRRVLHERSGELGMGEPAPQPRPIIGSLHVETSVNHPIREQRHESLFSR